MSVYESSRKIYLSRDYEMFKIIQGNRFVDPKRVYDLKTSIEENGWLPSPIMVNERYEIIDGQGRFLALKALEMPIEFVIAPNADMREVIALNTSSTRWRMMDYIDSYADRGVIQYITLRQLLDKYMRSETLNLRSILTVINLIDKSVADGNMAERQLKKGTYSLKEETAAAAEPVLDWLSSHSALLHLISAPRKPQLVRAVAFAYVRSSADKCQLDKALLRIETEGKRIGADNLNECLDYVSDAYNKRLPSGIGRIYLRPQYDVWQIHGTEDNKGEVK